MKKVAIMTHHPHETPEDRGRMAHALHMTRDVVEAGADAQLIFCGRSVEWLPQLTNPERDQEHKFVQHYGNVFDAVRDHARACNFCCIRFGVRDRVEQAGVPILGGGRDHMNLGEYALGDWKIVSL